MNIKPIWLLHVYIFYYVFSENLALHKSAWQSGSWRSDTGAERAVDGLFTDLRWAEDSVRGQTGDKQQSGGWI